MIFGPCEETSYTAITLNRVKLYSPREESFPIPLKYIDVSRTTRTNLDVRKNAASMTVGISVDQEICLILGQVSFSSLYLVRNLQTDKCGNRIRNHFLPALDLWDLIVAVLGNTNQNDKARGDLCPNQLEVRSTPFTIHKRKQSHGMINYLEMFILFPQTSILLTRKLYCMCLKTTKQ